jgi:Acetyltransferase (GNAT) domain
MHTIREVAAHDERWLNFCAQHPELTLFASPGWSDVIERTYGFSTRVLLVIEGDAVVGGLPFAHIEDFRGPRRVAFAFADNIEPIPSSLWPQLEAWIAQDVLPWNVRTLCEPQRAASSREAAKHHAIDLPATLEDAHRSFHVKHVQNLKQAQRAGLSSRTLAGLDGIECFYDLHSRVRKNKHGLLPQPVAFFREIHAAFFPDRGFVLVAEQEGTPVSAMLFLICNQTLYYKFSASALDALAVRPNHFLITKAIEWAIGAGLRRLDLGISDTEGLIRFKERIGGVARPVYAAAYNLREKTPEIAQVERAFTDITTILTAQDAPLEGAQRGGDVLYRFFT